VFAYLIAIIILTTVNVAACIYSCITAKQNRDAASGTAKLASEMREAKNAASRGAIAAWTHVKLAAAHASSTETHLKSAVQHAFTAQQASSVAVEAAATAMVRATLKQVVVTAPAPKNTEEISKDAKKIAATLPNNTQL
jgi:hypothetical protein